MMPKKKSFGLRLSEVEREVLSRFAEIEGLSEAVTSRRLLRYTIKELLIMQLEPVQARSKNKIEQRKIKKKRRVTLKQKTKKTMKRVSDVVFPIATHIFTRLVVETMIRLEIIPFVWATLEKVIVAIVGGFDFLN